MPGVNINARLLLLYIHDDLMVMILAIQSIHDDRHSGNIANTISRQCQLQGKHVINYEIGVNKYNFSLQALA